ncbi:MAG: DUF5372 family protein, partial [Bacillota bacterium]
WKPSSIAPHDAVLDDSFRITHPFHPWAGRSFELACRERCWGEDRIQFYSSNGRLMTVPAEWTDIASPDPFVAASSGRSMLRVSDLPAMAMLLKDIANQLSKKV